MNKSDKKEINKLLMSVKYREKDCVHNLYIKISPMIRYIAYKYCYGQCYAEDLIQDFWADIYLVADKFTYFRNAYSYLYKVMISRAKNRYREMKNDSSRKEDFVEYKVLLSANDKAQENMTDEILTMKAGLEKLDKVENIIIQKIYFEEKTIRQIGKELDIPKSTVERIKQRAIQKLKIFLQ